VLTNVYTPTKKRYIADPDFKMASYVLPLGLTIYSVVVTWSYLIINDPVFHQVSYAILVLGVVYRAAYLFNKVPKSLTYEKPRLQSLLCTAALGFILAFILWNIDNQFCSSLRSWRHSVSLLTGSISEVSFFFFFFFCLNILQRRL
jgi:dihydroceramidase